MKEACKLKKKHNTCVTHINQSVNKQNSLLKLENGVCEQIYL